MKSIAFLAGLTSMLLAPADDFNLGGGGQPDMETDPLGLSLDLNDVDTSMPVLMEGLYILVVEKVEVVENKEKTGNNLKVTFATVADGTSLSGNESGNINDIKAGHKLFTYMPLQDNPEKPEFKHKTNHARFQDAVTGSKQGNRGPYLPSTYVGQQVMAKVKVQKDEEWGVRNNIANLSKVPQ